MKYLNIYRACFLSPDFPRLFSEHIPSIFKYFCYLISFYMTIFILTCPKTELEKLSLCSYFLNVFKFLSEMMFDSIKTHSDYLKQDLAAHEKQKFSNADFPLISCRLLRF